MKWFLIISALASIFIFTPPANAQTITKAPEKESVSKELGAQINQLKEKIASRVSELDLVEKRGIIGTVDEIKTDQVTLIDLSGNKRFVDVDELTKFSSLSTNKSFGISDLKKGERISVLGNYNKQSKRILARFIKTYTVPTRVSGMITTINSQDFQVVVRTKEQKEIKVDIDTTTDTFAYSKDAGLVQYGFSKLKPNDRIIVFGHPDAKDPTLVKANRAIVFINVPGNPQIQSAAPPAAATQAPVTIAPTGTGGKAIKPIK